MNDHRITYSPRLGENQPLELDYATTMNQILTRLEELEFQFKAMKQKADYDYKRQESRFLETSVK